MSTFLHWLVNGSGLFYWIIICALFFILITGRYLLVAGLFYGIFYVWQPEQWKQRKLSSKPYPAGQLKKEIKWSTLSSTIFALAGALAWWLWQARQTLVYTDITAYGWWYLPLSLLLSMFIQEAYYYWLHRLMHHKAIFSIVHKVHHNSMTTSPFTAFSFHPLESVIQAVVLLVIPMVLPLHPLVILTQLTFMSFTSVINHLNIDIFPNSGTKKAISQIMIGATHHSLHHKRHQKNFGLYFTFWDKLLNTEYQRPAASQLEVPVKERNIE